MPANQILVPTPLPTEFLVEVVRATAYSNAGESLLTGNDPFLE